MKKILFILCIITSLTLAQLSIAKPPKDIDFTYLTFFIRAVLIDTDNDNEYDYYVVFVNGDKWKEGPLLLKRYEPSQGDPFPNDSYIVVQSMGSCLDQTYYFDWVVYDTDSVQIANFSSNCGNDTSFYDYLPAHQIVSSIKNFSIENIYNELSLYPNPIDDYFIISTKLPVLFRRIEIYNILGKLVHSSDINTNQHPSTNFIIELNNIPIGIYNCLIKYDQQQIFIRLIKK